MSPAGAVNAWKCDRCGRLTVAVHIDEGVTPMFLACRASEGCEGRAISVGYPPPPVPEHVLKRLAFEWYRPSDRWARRQSPAMAEHIARGGLVIRELTDAGRAVLEASG